MKKISIFLFCLFTPNLGNIFATTEYVYLGGESVGIVMNGSVNVSNKYQVNNQKPWSNTNIEIGTSIISFNNIDIETNQDLRTELLKVRDIATNITYKTNDIIYSSVISAVNSYGTYSLGLDVSDSLEGIGTLTYIKDDLSYGALGHIIKTDLSNGYISDSLVTSIRKGESGSPGYKKANLGNLNLGSITQNNFSGIFGILQNKDILEREIKIPVGYKEDIEVGPAIIHTVISGNEVKEFDINISSIEEQDSKDVKSMKIEIVDSELINATGGIVQGMSGSPIVQNGKIIGAVTHVLIDNPTEGYGIYVEWMIN